MPDEIIEVETPETPPEAPPVEPPGIAPEVVQEAVDTGWIPEDQFKGDKSMWRDADKWVERGRELIPIIKTHNKTLRTEVATLKSAADEQSKTLKRLIKMSESTTKQAYERAKADIVQQQESAVTEGDVETFQRLEKRKDELVPPELPETKEEPAEGVANPEYLEWHKKNDWFLTDQDMTDFANAYAARIDPKLAMPVGDRCATVEKKVRELFPQKFNNPNRNNPSPVDGGSVQPAPPASDGNAYADLPVDVKTVCNRNVKDGLYKNKEVWAKAYFEEE
jgi:hypothetical protein